MEVKIVLGTLWGDEGKGNTVQWLCRKALEEGKKPCVVRFSGGPQAGHTVHNGVLHVCSSFGSGVLLGVPTLYIGGLIDPLCVRNERRELEKKGIRNPVLKTWPLVRYITPYDVLDQQKWAEDHSGFTCGKGVYSAVNRSPEIVINSVTCGSPMHLAQALHNVGEFYKNPKVDNDVMEDWIAAALGEDIEIASGDFLKDYNVLVFEGTQGLLLDSECGFYPFCTSTKVGLNAIPKKHLEGAEVYLVMRTYLTRHGEMGPFDRKFIIGGKRNFDIPESKLETNTFNKFQGEFRVAPMNCLPVEMAVYRHHLDNYQKRYRMKFNLAVTHMDIPDLYPLMSTREVASALSVALTNAGLKLSNVYGAYGPDSNFRLLNSYDN